MKIAIIGLGAASFGTFLALEKYCEKISCLDIFTKKKKISDEQKIYTREEIVNFSQYYMYKLRMLGASVELYPEAVKINKQLSYADKRGVKFVIMIIPSF